VYRYYEVAPTMQFTIGLLQFCQNLTGFGLECLELDQGLFGGFCDVTKVAIIQKII
jgi:hypothetical protein